METYTSVASRRVLVIFNFGVLCKKLKTSNSEIVPGATLNLKFIRKPVNFFSDNLKSSSHSWSQCQTRYPLRIFYDGHTFVEMHDDTVEYEPTCFNKMQSNVISFVFYIVCLYLLLYLKTEIIIAIEVSTAFLYTLNILLFHHSGANQQGPAESSS